MPIGSNQQRAKDEAEIRSMIGAWSRAVEAMDVDAILGFHAPEMVLFDAMPPYMLRGHDGLCDVWLRCFAHFPKVFRFECRDLAITIDGDMAFSHALNRFVAAPSDPMDPTPWIRVTSCYRRLDGHWRIVHEHVSMPFDPATGMVVPVTHADVVAISLN